MKRFLLLISVIVLCGVLFNTAKAQNQKNVDSLMNLLRASKDDTNRVNHLNILAWDLMNTNPDSAIFVGKQSLALSEKLKWKRGIASSLGRLGVYYWNKADYPKALEYDFKALKMNEELGYKDRAAANLSNIGIIYGKQADYPKALYYYFKSLKIGEELGNKEAIANNLMNIGIVYKEQENDSKALFYYFKALKIYEERDNKNGTGTALTNIGNVYKGQREYSKAMDYYSRSLKIREELGNKKGIATTLSNMASLYMLTGKFKESEENIKKAISIASALDIKKELREFEGNLSRLYDTTAQLAVRNGQFAIAAENYKLSMRHYKKAVAIKDTLFNMEKSKELTRKEMSYEFQKKEAATKAEQEKKDLITKKEIQKQKLIRNGLLTGFGLVLIFAGIFFNQRNKIRKEKNKSENLLLNILPFETAQELKSKGSADAKLIDHVTVLFTDFKGFTTIAEKLSPQELVADLNVCFSEFDRIMEKYGIEKIKTIGDSYMAAGGLPTPNDTHASDVVKAALEIRDFIEEGKQRKISAGLPYFEIRIGVHTGPVVAGIVGVKKFAYDIWGDTVNTASRMESSGEIGKVNISETTYGLVKDKFNCEFRAEVEVKGKGLVKMYFVELDK